MSKIELESKTKVELLKLAQRLGLRGVSTLNKEELTGRIQRARQRVVAAIKRRAIRKPNFKATSAGRSGSSAKPAGSATRPKRPKTAPAAKTGLSTRKRITAKTAPEPVLAELAAHKFDVTPKSKPPKQVLRDENLGELPDSYGTGRLFLTARDPHWLFAYGDFTSQQLAAYQKQSVDGRLVLRVFEKSQGAPISEVPLQPNTRNWYIPVMKTATTCSAELGFWRPDGAFQVVSRSGETTTPADTVSADNAARFVTIPVEVSFAELSNLVSNHVPEGAALATVLQQLQTEGVQFPFEVDVDPGPWTPEQEAQLERLICGYLLPQSPMGSAEISEWLRRRLQEEVSSGSVSAFSPAGASWPGGAAQPEFWLAVNAELIIYGATTPDAKVTIDGRPVALRNDGTFSFHHSFPDGHYRLPLVAVAGQCNEQRVVELQFARQTATPGNVGQVTPPEPRTPPPSAT